MRAISISNRRENTEGQTGRGEIADTDLTVHVAALKPPGAEAQTTGEVHPSRRVPLIAIGVASIVAITLIAAAGADRAEQKRDYSSGTALGEIGAPLLARDSLAIAGPPSNTTEPLAGSADSDAD